MFIIRASFSTLTAFMWSEGHHHLHVFCVPFMAQGHMIPMVDLAKLFASHGADVSLIAMSHDSASYEKIVDQTRPFGSQIKTHLLEFPDTSKNLDSLTTHDDIVNFISSLDEFQEPLKRLVEKHRPDCIVSDFFLPWTMEVATQFGIPRLVFTGSSFFSYCVTDSLQRHRPHDGVASDSEPFVVPGLPHLIELTRSQLSDNLKKQQGSFIERVKEADRRSFGAVMNSFQELERHYIEHFEKTEMGKKAWAVGPLSLCNRTTADMAERGKRASISAEDCLKWLDTKMVGSVVYVCFGSMCRPSDGQLLEIALALESADRPFLWVVSENTNKLLENERLPEGLEERLKGRGLIIRGWAPQVLILNHPAVGAFVSHCGWNSVLEGVTAGVAMITWPFFAEQFYNEKLITQVLRIGVPVGSEVWVSWENPDRPLISKEKIEKAIAALMDGGDEAEGMRKRARELGEMASRAVEVGGSSYKEMSRLINDVKMCGGEPFGKS
ncbi:hypothetical protein ACLOJK_007480 [Asimina triloba]